MNEKEELGKCIICGGKAAALCTLIQGEPAFCSDHYNPKDIFEFTDAISEKQLEEMI